MKFCAAFSPGTNKGEIANFLLSLRRMLKNSESSLPYSQLLKLNLVQLLTSERICLLPLIENYPGRQT